MKYKIKQAGKTQKIIEVHISKEIISRELNRIYQEISETASLPGFRTGKIPIELVKKRYKKEAQDEAVRKLLRDSFKEAVVGSDIKTLGLPEVSDLQFEEEKGMSYKATVDIKPQVKLRHYKGLNLKKVAVSGGKNGIKESDIDSQINSLREANAKFVTKGGSATTGDYIICDIEWAGANQSVEKKENVWLYVGDDAFIPGKQLEGMKVNDEKDIEKALPNSYSKKELAGKMAHFHIKVKEVKEKVLSELNDEFAATVGNFRSMAELREAIRKTIKRKNELEERRQLEEQALKLLDKMAVFDVPQFMVDRHLDTLVNETKERLKRENFSEDEIKSKEKDFRERLSKEAIREVRAYFILEEIAKSEDIKVNGKEIESTFNILASTSGRSVDEVKKYYEENNSLEDLKAEIKQRKVLDFIIKNANIS